jgi:hypothetical protein
VWGWLLAGTALAAMDRLAASFGLTPST